MRRSQEVEGLDDVTELIVGCRDFRGGRLTDDGHIGTDFRVPPGALVVAAAPGVVRRVYEETNRGGLEVVIEHGAGSITTSGHLGHPGPDSHASPFQVSASARSPSV